MLYVSKLDASFDIKHSMFKTQFLFCAPQPLSIKLEIGGRETFREKKCKNTQFCSDVLFFLRMAQQEKYKDFVNNSRFLKYMLIDIKSLCLQKFSVDK